jgi:tetratricopeptide (TPR) repeat protein
VADAHLLAIFSQLTETPLRFRDASDQDWREALADAARVGLLNGVAGIYGMPPALPAYLAAEWRREEPAGHDAIRDAAVRSLLAASLTLFRWIEREIKSGDAATAFIAIETEYRTFCGLLGYALDHGLWREAGQITDPMHEYWKARSLTSEAEYWASKVRAVTAGAPGELLDFDTPAGQLWLTFVDGWRTARRDSNDNAESIHRRILADLRAQPSSPQRQGRIVATLGRLGEFTEGQGRFDEAADLYREALDISEGLEDDHLIASGYYHLGELALRRDRLDEAEGWFHKNLPIANELDFKPGLAGTLYSLGTIAENRGRPDDSEQRLRQSLSICEDLNDKSLMAKIFHGLGKVAELRWSLSEARDGWRRQEAREWYHKSLALNEETGDMVGMAMMFGQLGRLSVAQGDLRGALEWTIKCLVSFNEISHPWAERALGQLASITYALSEEYGEEYGVEFASEVWREVTGDPFPMKSPRSFPEWSREQASQTP